MKKNPLLFIFFFIILAMIMLSFGCKKEVVIEDQIMGKEIQIIDSNKTN